MRRHLQEALALGKLVLHRSGEEGIDELWGEPFKAFAFPVEDFYRSRYLKVAMTMQAIDAIAAEMNAAFDGLPAFAAMAPLVDELAAAARAQSETLRSDPDMFDVWTSFAVALREAPSVPPSLARAATDAERQRAELGLELVREGVALVDSIARARVPMPKSTAEYIERCRSFAKSAVRPGEAQRSRKPALESLEALRILAQRPFDGRQKSRRR